MAFSQKHSGKVLVPWYNKKEWRHVYNLITSPLQDQIKQAVDILNMWKLRTPVLSAGVQGTLILLEAILVDENKVSEFEICQIYSMALLRFLNICTGSSDKQGTFSTRAARNDVPKWLIDIRHDIAHGSRLPSKSMLSLALAHSLKWLIEKYWDIQNHTICNYTGVKDNTNNKLIDILNTYIRLSISLYEEGDMVEYDTALMEKINYLVSKRYNTMKTDKQGLHLILEEMLRQSLSNLENKEMGSKIANTVVSSSALFSMHVETNAEGTATIPKKYRNMWLNLLNILLDCGFLDDVLNQLLTVYTDSKLETLKKKSYVWICSILDGLMKYQMIEKQLLIMKQEKPELDLITTKTVLKSVVEESNPDYKNCVEFQSDRGLSVIKLESFEDRIVNKPCSMSVEFLEKVMVLNNKPDHYRNLVKSLVKNYLPYIRRSKAPKIFTINDLPVDVDTLRSNRSNEVQISNEEEGDHELTETTEQTRSRWKRIKVTSNHKDHYPLGVLPYQDKNTTPLEMTNGVNPEKI